jgi:hypothetical protein
LRSTPQRLQLSCKSNQPFYFSVSHNSILSNLVAVAVVCQCFGAGHRFGFLWRPCSKMNISRSRSSGVTQNRPTGTGLGDVECDARHDSLRRYEQRLERSEITTSGCLGALRMATAAHRARDGGASGDRRRLSVSGRDRSASAGGMDGEHR